MYNPPTAPLSIGGVLDDGFRLLKASFTKVFPLALLYSLVSAVPSMMMPTPSEAGAMPEISGGVWVAFLLSSLLCGVFYGGLIASVDAIAKCSPIATFDAIEIGVQRFLPMVGCFILMSIAFLGGTLLLIVPGLILMVSLSFAPYLLVTEGMGALESLKASHRLVRGNWWRTATILTVVLFIIIAASFLAGLLSGGGAALGMAGADSSNPIFPVLAALINAVLVPLYFTFGLVVLRDLQLRKLGGDLEQRIGAIKTA